MGPEAGRKFAANFPGGPTGLQTSESPTTCSGKAPAEDDGTGVANVDQPMKNPQETNKVAGPGVQDLPVGEKGNGTENNLPPETLAGARVAGNHGMDLNFDSVNNGDRGLMAGKASVLDTLDLPALADARMRAVDRTHDMMVLHSMRLVESKSDVLSVVIKPAVGMELSLELHQHADGVEAQATLLRGDHQFLSEHWEDLQQRLELRGIKLAGLNYEGSSAAGDNGHFQQQQAAQEEEAAQQASAYAEFAATGPGGGATARLAALHDGWESWA